MKVTEEQRRALFERVRAHLDEETATLLLEVTVPANVELATRGDLQEFRAEMLLRFTELDGRLTGQISELDRRLTGQITELDRRLTGQIAQLDGQIAQLGKALTDVLYRRVIPAVAVMLGVATWLGMVTG
jgi:hypothetical protein